jgi:aminoglycoside 3-N-acetyltransferase
MNLKPTKLLSERWRSSGIEPGMLLLVHSNILRTMQEFQKEDIPLTVNDILDSFIEAVGPEGTLLFPLFNFDFCWGKSFDMRTSKSSMGALTEAARLRTDSVRTGHPVYSFAVLGRLKEKFRGLNNLTAYGAGSPFDMVHSMRGYIAVLDLPDQASMTFYHHVEEMEKIPYRYQKKFRCSYTDLEGHEEMREYFMNVRDLDAGVCTHVEPTGDELWSKGLYKGFRVGEESGLRVIYSEDAYQAVSAIIRSGRAEGMLYRIKKPTEK